MQWCQAWNGQKWGGGCRVGGLWYTVLIPRACDYVPLHGKRHWPLVADNMGLVPRGETWRHLGPEMGEGVQERSQEGGKPGEIHGECSGGVTRPEAEHDRTGIRWLWQPVTSPSAVRGRWPCGFLGVCSDVDQVSGERKGPVRACHDPPSPTEESGVAGDPGGGLCVAPSRAQAGRSVGRGRRLATCAFETCGARRHGGAGGATLCSGKHLVKSAFTGLEHSSKCISFLGEKDQETKMRLFGFQANHMTCL